MSTNTQAAHFLYTTNEWISEKHQSNLDIIFKNNDIKNIYDIGANVGGTAYTFLEYAKRKNKNIEKIICFEPDKDNIDFLKEKLNKEINDNVVVPIHKGVYYGKKKAKVFQAGNNSEGFIHANVGGYSIEECMKSVTNNRIENGEDVFCGQVDDKEFELDELENLIDNSLKPDFIKIDVEGAEKNILENSNLIKETKYMIVEWNQKEDIKNFLEKNNINFKVVNLNSDVLLINNNLLKLKLNL